MDLDTTLADLKAALDPLLPIFLLIDPMVGEPIALEGPAPSNLAEVMAARQAAWQRDILNVQLHATSDLPAHLQPYLVMLRGIDDTWLQDSLEIAHQENTASQTDGLAGTGMAIHRIGGWLQTQGSVDALAAQIAALARVHNFAPTKARYVRLADRRTLEWFRCIAGDTHIAASLTLLKRWVYLDTQLTIAKLQPSAQLSAEPVKLKLTQAQWKYILQGSALHTTTARWLGQLKLDALPLPTTPLSETYQRVWQALQLAHSTATQWPLYFKTEADRCAWAVLALLQPDMVHSYAPQWLQRASALRTDPPQSMNTACHQLLADYQKHTL
jgi:hypothetical protein